MELKRFKMYPLICHRSRYKNILLDHYVKNPIQLNKQKMGKKLNKKSRRPLLLLLHDYNQICLNTFPPKYRGNTLTPKKKKTRETLCCSIFLVFKFIIALTQRNNSKLPQKECYIYTKQSNHSQQTLTQKISIFAKH